MPQATRSTRPSSRTSSPFVGATRDSPTPAARDLNGDGRQKTSQEWVEPARAAAQPSFMDHKFDRTSIFQDMQPLGAMPSAKLRQKMRESHARRLMAGEPAGLMAVDEEHGSTETTPAVETQSSESARPEATPPQPVPQQQKDEQTPEGRVSSDVARPVERVQRLRITNVNGATPIPSASNTPPPPPPPALPTTFPAQQLASPSTQTTVPNHQQETPSPLKSPIKMATYTHTWNKDSSDATIAVAAKRADEIGGKRALLSKLALMEAFRLSEHDERLHHALAAVGSGVASAEQVRRFNNYIKRSKIRLRKELEKGELRFPSLSMGTLPIDVSATPGPSQGINRLSLTPGSGHPATNISAQIDSGEQQSLTATPPGIPHVSAFPLTQPESLASPTSPQETAAAVHPPQPSTPKPATPKPVEAPSAMHTPQAKTEALSAAQTPQAPAAATSNGELPLLDTMNSPVKQSSEQDSDGELSDVNETLIRRVENENYMQSHGGADSGDDRAKKRRRFKDKRVAKSQPGNQHRKKETRQQAQTAAEEEQRLDDERKRYKDRYLEEQVPNFPRKDEYTESYLRTLPTPPVQSPPRANGHLPAASKCLQPKPADAAVKAEKASLGEVQLNGAHKRRADELDDSASSLTEDLGSTPSNSGPGTPQFPPPSKKQKTAAKTKISPIKSRNRVVAGVSRPGGGRSTPFANDDNDKTSDDEHSDYCGACGGEGELLCCDGCDAAYHFECCDPPLTKNSPELEEAWYCQKCRPLPRRSRDTSLDSRDSIWGNMGETVHHYDQRNFQLPKSLQNYFEDNCVGLDGEYVTGQVTYSRASHAKDGVEEHADYYRLVDKKEKAILCCQCLQGVGFESARRPIIQCDKPHCYAYWHLDCLDPPLANPPTRGWQKGYQKTRVQWVCPRHAEHDHREIQNPAFNSTADQVMPAPVTGMTRHRMRIPRKPGYVDYHRGMHTQGRVDIVNRDEDDDAALRFYEEDDLEGKVVRMPEDDVKLNFIAKVKADRMLVEQQCLLKRRKLSQLDPAFQRRSFNDQRAALSLAQLAERQNELDVNADGVAQLVYALTAQAEGEYEGGDIAPTFNINLNDRKQREQLIKVRRLIDMALANGEQPTRFARAQPNGVASSTAPAAQLPEPAARLESETFLRASSLQPIRPSKRQHLDLAEGDAMEVRSEGGLEPRMCTSGSFDDREAVSAPGSRPSSRRETRRTSNRRSAFGSK